MKLSMALGSYPASRPLSADQIMEYHAARLVLLFHICGVRGRLQGLTKLAKLDFFVRYPVFFDRAAAHLTERPSTADSLSPTNDSAMIRHHYGPWDPRYYQVLAYLEGRELIHVQREKKTFVFILTQSGQNIAKQLFREESFLNLVNQMHKVKAAFGGKTGDWLKKLIYRIFDQEVAQLARGEEIR